MLKRTVARTTRVRRCESRHDHLLPIYFPVPLSPAHLLPSTPLSCLPPSLCAEWLCGFRVWQSKLPTAHAVAAVPGLAAAGAAMGVSGNGGGATMAGGAASGAGGAESFSFNSLLGCGSSPSTSPFESFINPTPCPRCGKDCEYGTVTRCTCGAVATGLELRPNIIRSHTRQVRGLQIRRGL